MNEIPQISHNLNGMAFVLFERQTATISENICVPFSQLATIYIVRGSFVMKKKSVVFKSNTCRRS